MIPIGNSAKAAGPPLLAFLLVAAPLGSGEEKKPSPSGEAPEKVGKGAAEKKEAEEANGAESGSEKPGAKADQPGGFKGWDPDVTFVKENLKSILHGDIKFYDDGTVTINYDLRARREEHQNDFKPPIATGTNDVFRWSLPSEYYGVRISGRGASFLNIWFIDDLEAAIDFIQGTSWTKTQIAALAFQSKNGNAIGCNFGTQCATFSGGNFKGGAPAAPDPLMIDQSAKFGLRVKGGTFESFKNDRSKKTSKYPSKSFTSGRIGFIWGGGMAGTIRSLAIKGKIDYTATAKEIRKAQGGK